MGFFEKLKKGLFKTKQAIFGKIDALFKHFVRVDEDLFEELEELLIEADIGVDTTEELLDTLREWVKDTREKDPEAVKRELYRMLKDRLGDAEPLRLDTKPSVILVIGVNGVGKTTSIGKIAAELHANKKKVIVAAADTFRAAATEQLAVWCQRAKVDLIRGGDGADPAAVVFDAVQAAKSRGADVLIVDTAGRLHNKKNLMAELHKINNIIDKEFPEAYRETLVVLDGTTGQNALAQAKEFSEVTDLSGIVLTKLDGTAKGGIAVAIQAELGIPVKYIGVGEGVDDLEKFDAQEFVDALFFTETE